MRIAVIGAGVIGRLRAENVKDHPATALVGLVDVDQALVTREAARLGTTPFTDHRRMLDAVRPDAVIVSSPVTLHEAMCRDAFAAGCHVLVEKPLANTVAACEAILAAAAAAGRVLAVGFNHRFYPAARFAREVVASGRIGTLDHVRVFGGHDGLRNFRADWMYQGELSGGGAMMDVGIHLTDLACHLAGDVTEAYGVASGAIWQVPGSEDNAMAVLKTAGGVPIFYQATWTEWRGYGWRVDVYGDRGMVRASYAPMYHELVLRDPATGALRKTREFYLEGIVREKLRGWETTTSRSFALELEDFLRRVRGEQAREAADGWAGLRANLIAQAVYRSSREGVPVPVPPRAG